MKQTIGFIGIGAMGKPMSLNFAGLGKKDSSIRNKLMEDLTNVKLRLE